VPADDYDVGGFVKPERGRADNHGMSVDDERPVPPDLFSAAPAAAGSGRAVPQFAPAGPVYASIPTGHGRRKSGPVRQVLAYIAVICGGLLVLSALTSFWMHSVYNSPGSGGGPSLILGAALLYTGSREIRSKHLDRSRALPWLMGFTAVCIVVAVVVVYQERHDYPMSVQTSFLTSCEAHSGDPGRCGCALHWFESHESLTEFIALNNEIGNGGRIPADVAAGITAACPVSTTT
jgi:hypothetical protein